MVRRKRRDRAKSTAEVPVDTRQATISPLRDIAKLPKGAVRKINIGQSFAEYDMSLNDRNVYVYTPALSFAEDPDSGKVFFVGRRGTGKTAIRRFCAQDEDRFQTIVPEIFSPSSVFQNLEQFANVRQRPFKSLVSAFRRALQIELLNLWKSGHSTYYGTPPAIDEELKQYGDLDFDERCLCFIRRISEALTAGDDDRWLKENKAVKGVAEGMKTLGSSALKTHTLLIDSIDDYWEGSDEGLVYLTAFMHACLETTAQIPWARTILFLRENIFERVRAKDPESSRLETAVIGMDWTESQLLELIERRLNNSLTAKIALGGPTWGAFFESPEIAWNNVMEFCQRRPRDVLIYISHAVEAAQNNGHERIQLKDIEQARRRFSDNRFKDLGDEYAENYPQIALVLSRFYGLGNAFTYGGIESFIRKILNDLDVIRHCSSWLYDNAATEKFIRLLYGIGFVGFRAAEGPMKFRALGPQETSPPPILDTTDIVIHKCYWDALDLQDRLVRDLPESKEFGKIGKIEDLPGGLDVSDYADALDLTLTVLREIPLGPDGATDFEEVVGDVIKLCFFRALENIEERVKDYEGRVVRDWIASNRARDGFWAMVRDRYDAVQVIWECKNYADLSADDFHQLNYYMTDIGGRFIVLAYRGDLKPFHLQHIRRIANNGRGFILPLGEKDLMIFLRQAMNGKIKEDHIQDRFDSVLRKIT
ncbi:P-loop ATPase, Sll1717 family [Nonomuraea glycinis]|uniref:P-loop ATPase, Sll1717 family n=1 Tax=Nonomuraea glycinis TaxID=2047744 RepID=UPI0033AB4C6E